MSLIKINKPFLKIPWNKPAIAYYVLMTLNTFLYTLIFDTPRIYLYNLTHKEEALILLLFALFNLFLFFLLMLSKWVFIIINPVLFYIGAVGYIYADKFYIDTDMYSAPTFLLHHTITASNPITIYHYIFLISMFLTGLSLGIIRFIFAVDKSVIRRGQAFAFIVIISIFSYTYLYNNYNHITMQPFAFIKGVKDYTVSSISYKIYAGKRQNISSAVKTQDNITGIVILLDKLNKDIFTKYNSYLTKQYDFITFSNFKTEFTNHYNTRSAVLTGATADKINNIINNRSFMALFSNAGYKTGYVGIYNSLIAKDNLNYSIIKKDVMDIYEEYTPKSPNIFRSLYYLDDFLKNNDGGLFLINIEGSSHIISNRYDSFIETQDEHDTYKNYASYIDAFLYEVISSLKDRPSFIIVMGLEGEIIKDNRVFQNEKTSSMTIWVSKNMERLYNTKTNILSNMNDMIFNDTLYNTIQGCFMLKNKDINNGRNLCRVQNK